eukprot:5719538-Prymnesium_polylepis.1
MRRASSAPVVTLSCAYRDRRVNVSLLQRCRSGGRRRLTAGRGGGYMGWFLTAVWGLRTLACDPS